jgi:hypothetical protein
MAQEPEKICYNCNHTCHCYGMSDAFTGFKQECSEEIGVGMTDKSQPCGCKKCDCDRTRSFFDD